EDKEPLFDAADTLDVCIAACVGMVADMQPNAPVLKEAAQLGFATATDFADWIVRSLNMPFRDAHHVTGAAVKLAEGRGCRLDELDLASLREIEPRITEAVYDVLDPARSVSSRMSFGGTAPANVRAAAAAARERFL
ncbi:MAG: argininosuccinate lyase, partial [Alphaproteobacteria bacterium]|nr:argininosuccinate lyase [Alphaproteobacteria bacterium]